MAKYRLGKSPNLYSHCEHNHFSGEYQHNEYRTNIMDTEILPFGNLAKKKKKRFSNATSLSDIKIKNHHVVRKK